MSRCNEFEDALWDFARHGGAAGSDLEEHLAGCGDCRKELQIARSLRAALAPAEDEVPPPAEAVLAAAGRAAPTPAQVLTPEELAAWLKVPVETIHENLGELPAFELGGRIRFRREAVEAWLRRREENWRRQSLAAWMKDETRRLG